MLISIVYLQCPTDIPKFLEHKEHDNFSGKTSHNNLGLLPLAHICYT